MYSLIRQLLFLLDPETAHTVTLELLNLFYRLGLTRFFTVNISAPHMCMGLHFKNRLGLAAGLDKNAEYVEALASLGFGFIEIGTVTPKPQVGNPRPRLFRIVKARAIINRMGFNGKGVEFVASQLKKIKYDGVLGVNIGKNKDTPNEKAVDDYLICMQALWPYASYFTINISSPNTPGLRDLQQANYLSALLSRLKQEQLVIQKQHQKYIPLVVKISPDLSDDELRGSAEIILAEKMDGVIATNTTISREGVSQYPEAKEAGGLSGAPLTARSTDVIKKLNSILQNNIPIIGVGGVMDKASAETKLNAGAELLQVYTGFIYAGPEIVGVA